MRLLITGALGFVGSHLTSAARALGHEVIAVSRPGNTARQLLSGMDLPVHQEQANLANRDMVSNLLKRWKPEVIFHVAARIPRGQGEDAFIFFNDNVQAALNIFHHARESGVRHVVYSSTMSVYGVPRYLPVNEEHPTQPGAAYGLSKLEGELYGELYADLRRLRVTVLRYSGIYGQGQKSGAIPTFIVRCLQNAPIKLHSRGRPSSDYVWVEDVVQANFLALHLATSPGFQVFNIGSGVELSLGELARLIRRLCRSNSEIHLDDESSFRDFRFAYDIIKARTVLGFSPTSPEIALQQCIRQQEASQ